MADRGILYVVWGDKVEAALQRSMESVRRHYPAMPIEVIRGGEASMGGFQDKTRMGSLTPFKTTLYLDADTVVLGNLDHAFGMAEEFGLACCICECPWARRYGNGEGDQIEYNTGVLFFTPKARPVFDTWESLAATVPATSQWIPLNGKPTGMIYEDQASLARAILQCRFNPFVLPMNYNVRPGFHRSLFTPVKIWHDYREVPAGLAEISLACERGERLVTYLEIEAQR